MTVRTPSFFALLVVLPAGLARPYSPVNPDTGAIRAGCYSAVAPALKKAEGKLTPEVRKAYLDWAEKTVLDELRQANQTVPEDCLADARAEGNIRDAIFGSVFPPDPSILQNYAQIRAQLGEKYGKFRNLALAVAVAKRIHGA